MGSGEQGTVWSPDQVENLRRRQAAEHLHPYTCGCGDHVELEPTSEGWRCPAEGRIVQRWAHADDVAGTFPEPLVLPMPADRRLTLLPASAAALADAEVGEEVDVRVAMSPQPGLGFTFAHLHPAVSGAPAVATFEHDGGVLAVSAPAAEGERVEVPGLLCPAEVASTTETFDPAGYDKNDCAGCGVSRQGHEPLPATITTEPVPERWCGGCKGRGFTRTGTVTPGVCVDIDGEWWHERCEVCAEDCTDCEGDPPYAWRLTLRREGAS